MGQEEFNVGHNDPRIVRGRIDSLSLYEITDYELGVLEKGSPGSLHLNFAIFLLSIGSSLLVTLLTTDIGSGKTFIVLVVISAVGISGGLFLILLWRRLRGEVTDVVEKIRERIRHESNTNTLDESNG